MNRKILTSKESVDTRNKSVPFFFRSEKNLHFFLQYYGFDTPPIRTVMQRIFKIQVREQGSLSLDRPEVAALCRSPNPDIQNFYKTVLVAEGFCEDYSETILFTNRKIADEASAMRLRDSLGGQLALKRPDASFVLFPLAEMYDYTSKHVCPIDLTDIRSFEPLAVPQIGLLELLFPKNTVLPAILISYNEIPTLFSAAVENIKRILLHISEDDPSLTGLYRTAIASLVGKLPERQREDINQQCNKTIGMQKQVRLILDCYFDYACSIKDSAYELLNTNELINAFINNPKNEFLATIFKMSRLLYVHLLGYEHRAIDFSLESILFSLVEKSSTPVSGTQLYARLVEQIGRHFNGRSFVLSPERYVQAHHAFIRRYAVDREGAPAKIVCREIPGKAKMRYYLAWQYVPNFLTESAHTSQQKSMQFLSQMFAAELSQDSLRPQKYTVARLNDTIREQILETEYAFFWSLVRDPLIIARLTGRGMQPDALLKKFLKNTVVLTDIYRIDMALLFTAAKQALMGEEPNVFKRFIMRILYYVRWFSFRRRLADCEREDAAMSKMRQQETPVKKEASSAFQISLDIDTTQLDRLWSQIPRFDFDRQGFDKMLVGQVAQLWQRYKDRPQLFSPGKIESFLEPVCEYMQRRVAEQSPSLTGNQHLREYTALRAKQALSMVAKDR